MQSNSGVNYQALEEERAQQNKQALSHKLSEITRDLGRPGSLRRMILGFVIVENYDKAKSYIQEYINARKEYPNFQNRAQKYVRYATDLVQAIQTKRNFPGFATLAISKQQEINDHVVNHFDELKQILKRIERTESETKLADLRGTAIFMTTLGHAVLFSVSLLFAVAVSRSLGYSFTIVFDALVYDLTNWVEKFLGWH